MKSSRKLLALDNFGAVGAFLAAAAAPCWVPSLAAAGAALGVGALQSWREDMDYAIEGFVGLSAFGSVFAYRRHRQAWLLGISLASATLVFFAFYASYHVALIYSGLTGFAVAAVWNSSATRRASACCQPVQLQSTLTCPHCGHRKQETMPTDACLYFYECQSCHTTLRPTAGNCCVFCCYGSVKCPPIQSGANRDVP